MNEQKNDQRSDLYEGFGQKIKSDSHETWKCVDAELQRQIRCFSYVELSDVPRLEQVEKKKPSDGRGISDYVGRRSTSDIIGQLSAVLSNKTKRDNIIENGNDIKAVNLQFTYRQIQDFKPKEKMKF